MMRIYQKWEVAREAGRSGGQLFIHWSNNIIIINRRALDKQIPSSMYAS